MWRATCVVLSDAGNGAAGSTLVHVQFKVHVHKKFVNNLNFTKQWGATLCQIKCKSLTWIGCQGQRAMDTHEYGIIEGGFARSVLAQKAEYGRTLCAARHI
jgi:hypothetical protein